MTQTASSGRRVQPATLALGAAALVAIGVVAWSTLFRGGDGAATATNLTANAMAAGQAPSVQEMAAGLIEQVRRDPDDHEGWFRLGMAYRNMEDFEQASAAFRRSVELQPRNADYNNYLAEMLLIMATRARQPAPPEAERLLRIALQAAPGNAMSRFYLATIRDDRGDHRGAVDDLIALLRDPPGGAPLPPQVRSSAIFIAQRSHIDISNRLPPETAAPAGGDRSGAEIATAGIPGPSPEQLRAAGGMTPSQQSEQGRNMVEGLARRLQGNPRDANGWIMLMRSRMVLGEPQRAAEALRTALATFQNDPATQARLRQAAQALAIPGA